MNRVISFWNLPDEAIRLASSFLPWTCLLGLINSCKRFHSMPFLGFSDKLRKYIQVVIALDATGSMRVCMENLKPTILMIMSRVKDSHPDYVVQFSIVEYSDIDTCFSHSMEYVPQEARMKVADIVYHPGSHFISIQSPLRNWAKLYKMVDEMRLMGGGGSEAFDYAIVKIEEEFRHTWVYNQPFSQSVDYLVIIQDIVGHRMGNDGTQSFHRIYDKHGMRSDWFGSLKRMSDRNVVFVHLAINTNENPSTLRHFGRICAALGGYSLNITPDNVFEIPEIIVKIMKPELMTRKIIRDAYVKVAGSVNYIENDVIRDVVLQTLSENKSVIPEVGFDSHLINKGSTEFEALVRSCSTLDDLCRAGVMPSSETSMLLIRMGGNSVEIVGEVDEEAKRERIRKWGVFVDSDSDDSDLADIPACAPGLTRQMTCASVSSVASERFSIGMTRSMTQLSSATNTRSLSVIDEEGEELPPMPPAPFGFPLNQTGVPLARQPEVMGRGLGFVRMRTCDGGEDGIPSGVGGRRNLFIGTPFEAEMSDKKIADMFGGLHEGLAPSRILFGLTAPRVDIITHCSKLEEIVLWAPLDEAEAALLNQQPGQRAIIEAKTFAKYCSSMELVGVDNESEGVDEPLPSPMILDRSVSVFNAAVPALARTSSVDGSNSQAVRNLIAASSQMPK